MASESVLAFLRVILIRLLQMKQNGNQKDLHVAIFGEDLSIYVNLTLKCLVPVKRPYILKQTCSFQLQVYLSMYDLLVDTRR